MNISHVQLLVEYVPAVYVCFIKSVINTRTIVGDPSARLRNGKRLMRLPFLQQCSGSPPLPTEAHFGGGPMSEQAPRGSEKAVAFGGCFFFDCTPLLLLFPTRPAALGSRGAPF